MKKLFFVLLILFVGAAMITASPVTRPPGEFYVAEAVLSGSVTANPETVLAGASAWAAPVSETLVLPAYNETAGLPNSISYRLALNTGPSVPGEAVHAPDYHLIC